MALVKRLVVYKAEPREGPGLDVLLQERGFQVYMVGNEEELIDILQYSYPDAALIGGPHGVSSLARFVSASQSGARSLLVVVWPAVPPREAAGLLDMGVDYVAPSFQPDWLAAQIRASLRRFGNERVAPTVIDLGQLCINLDQRQVTVHGREVPLTPTEFSVLRVLAERPGTVLPSGEIMQQVMGVRISEAEAQDLLKVHIHRLRQKLEPSSEAPRFIRTVRGHGYMYAFERRSRERSNLPATDEG